MKIARMRIIFSLIGVLVLSVFFQGLFIFNHNEGYEPGVEIPLNIYQTWKTKDLPEKMRENVDRLKLKNPDFEYHLFDDEDCRQFIQNNFEEDVLTAYDKIIPGAYKADLWRYCILYINGGVYLDIKYSNVDDFNLIELMDKEYFVPDLKDSGGGVYNAFMICKTGNKFLDHRPASDF